VFIRGIRSPSVSAERDGEKFPPSSLGVVLPKKRKKMEDIWQERKLSAAERKMRKSAVRRFDFVADVFRNI
jgi:hypothetical protein